MGQRKKLERVFIHRRADGTVTSCSISKKVGPTMAYWNGESWSSTAKVYTYAEAAKAIKRFRDKETNQALTDLSARVREIVQPLKSLYRPDEGVPGGISLPELINFLTNEMREEFT